MTESDRRKDDDEALKARLERLSSALEERKEQPPTNANDVDVSASSTGRALSLGMRVLSEFTAGVIAGAGIGWLLDKALSTSPLFLIVFVGLGNGHRVLERVSHGRRIDRRAQHRFEMMRALRADKG